MEVRLGLLLAALGSVAASSPEQVHLSFGDTEEKVGLPLGNLPAAMTLRESWGLQRILGRVRAADDPRELVVVWSTQDDPSPQVVEYGTDPGQLDQRANASRRILMNGIIVRRRQILHRAAMTGLVPATRYWYRVGENVTGWSRTFNVRTLPDTPDFSPRVAVYGDLGYENARSVPRLISEVEADNFDFILHIGDFAYDLNSIQGKVGDRFFSMIEPMAAHVPYMVAAGNHELFWNFTNYKTRFDMPNTDDNLMYSFKAGPALFLIISTEVYYFLELGGAEAIIRQYRWLEKQLEEANQPENRSRWPWIFILGHRPMYCSNNNIRDCGWDQNRIRVGIPLVNAFGLEGLLYKYGVDVAFWAHQHSYERMLPLYSSRIYIGSLESPYTNPRATVHITTGSAGCKERVDYFRQRQPPWSAFRSSDYGYSRMTIHNSTHLYLEQVSDDQGGLVTDKVWIIQENHGTFINR
ncbi:ACP7 [Cordylochernes scorpioides]|uniref:Purple acid phosphatase n=1 Tax=Cordylochernes scorpioides TaxID=51811 RepID=A0ABY6KBD5_9ARAC|nr:ACP7 [Cordylochernes scorpioides]